jgi:hypothetical protein
MRGSEEMRLDETSFYGPAAAARPRGYQRQVFVGMPSAKNARFSGGDFRAAFIGVEHQNRHRVQEREDWREQ